MKRVVIFVLIALAAVSIPVAPSAQDVARPAKVFTVAETTNELRRTYPAIVLPSAEVELSFRVSGQVVELPIRGAVEVEEGDLIAALDPQDFETQVAQLESQVDQAEAQLDALRTGARAEEIVALEAAVASAQAQVDQAREQTERTRELAERGVVADARLEQDEANLRVAEANLQAQIEQLRIGQSGGRPEEIDAAEAAIRGLEAQLTVARSNLGYATLEAPFAGIIARRDIDNFSNVQAGQSVALLQALSVVHLSFDVPGPDITALSRNGPGSIVNRVIFDSLPDQIFDSQTVEFSVQADTATQTYRARVAVAVPRNEMILPGMVGRVISTAPSEATALTIPLTAVASKSDGSPFVWVVQDGNTAVGQTITLGEVAGDHVVVTQGLSAGDTIISAGVSQIMDGMRIRPITQIGG
ncbi:efflux RND transporter periplasmic adaptor subunit [Aestuariivita sp.]|jgi:multidrug efflux pump subunit AcrA (membrane-fusion protein)|uniref:efflux RND transporter periplasmic adaptor subunit n=1 Tax=Aestuariivita sp. TaxID=1872407 RepID=UPI00216E23CF|nr:efflux RND transporter periplasmic adaptor subunit [Aestuariivita sp.]MCE8007049.1 efflux RND transporter periplasmic adaptor subunit [Aestuariivita sp.]